MEDDQKDQLPADSTLVWVRRPLKYILAEDGRTPVPMEDAAAWAEAYCTQPSWRVGLDSDPQGNVTVSTVFLGIDWGFGNPVPLTFETLISRNDDDDVNAMARYSTWEEAAHGHKVACEALLIDPVSLTDRSKLPESMFNVVEVGEVPRVGNDPE